MNSAISAHEPISRIKLARNGPEFSRLVFGCWRLLDSTTTSNSDSVLKIIEASLEAGITTFDHADIYGNYGVEALFGDALRKKKELISKIEIVTKTGIKLVSDRKPDHKIKSYDSSAAHIISSAETSLKVLGTHHIDLLLIHRPDYLACPDEISEAFAKLHAAGKVKHFGVSNFSVSQFDMLQSKVPFQLVTNQIEFNPFELAPITNGTLDRCISSHISPMAWSPLGGGRLFNPENPVARRVSDISRQILSRRPELESQAGIDHVIYAWLLAHPAKIIPVLGTANLSRIKKAPLSEKIKLTREEWYEIWQAASGREVP